MDTLGDLFAKLEKHNVEDMWEISGDFFMMLYDDTTRKELPCVNAFLIINSWFGVSLRSGVWTFYESLTDEGRKNLEKALDYLFNRGDIELANMLKLGNHDYYNPKYRENYDYPQEWIDESEIIDDWIGHNEKMLLQWEYDLLINNKDILIT